MSLRETALRLAGADGSLAALLHQPAPENEPATRHGLLLCPPLFEERKAAARVLTETAHRLCCAGWTVLRIDYRGCGDSNGALADFAPDDWLVDLAAAAAFLTGPQACATLTLLGLRFGANLAWRMTRDPGAPTLLRGCILWEPLADGRRYIEEALRQKIMKEMLTYGQARCNRRELLRRLEQGQSLDFDGYPLTPRLLREAAQCNLEPWSTTPAEPLDVSLVQIAAGNALRAPYAKWHDACSARGLTPSLACVSCPPFWSLVGVVDASVVPLPALPHTGAGSTPAAVFLGNSVDAGGERPVQFRSNECVLRGVVHKPDSGKAKAGVIMLHGWSGCRLGPHRVFVKTARELVRDADCACLRFDFRGRGESDGETADASIQSMTEDAHAAVAWMRDTLNVSRVFLLAICSGCKTAIGAAVDEPTVKGLLLWSAEPMGFLRKRTLNQSKKRRAWMTYARKLLRPETWRKLLTLRVNVGMVRKAVAQQEEPDSEEIRRETAILGRFATWPGEILFVFGDRDPATPTAAAEYTGWCAKQGIRHSVMYIADANHSFYSLDWERQVIDASCAWLRERMMSSGEAP